MKRTNRRAFLATTVTGTAALVAGAWGRADDAKPQTSLAALILAGGQMAMAQARYAAMARQADADGYGQAASLFRAAARSKEANVTDLGAVIKKLGGKLECDAKPGEVKSTKENVAALIKAETEAGETTLPELVAVAREEKNKEAVRALNYAKAAAAEYATLFAEAAADLEAWKAGKKSVYVCTVCGFPAYTLPEKKCPTCFDALDKFTQVS